MTLLHLCIIDPMGFYGLSFLRFDVSNLFYFQG